VADPVRRLQKCRGKFVACPVVLEFGRTFVRDFGRTFGRTGPFNSEGPTPGKRTRTDTRSANKLTKMVGAIPEGSVDSRLVVGKCVLPWRRAHACCERDAIMALVGHNRSLSMD
jgi:hypothetical protein